MKVRPLVLNDRAQEEVQRVLQHAKVHPMTLHDILAVMGGRAKPLGDDPGFSCIIPFGYRCVFNYEQQTPGWFRHLSVSVIGTGRSPNPVAVNALMREFGFTCGFEDADMVSTEDIAPGKIAVNVMQKIKRRP